MGNCSSNNGGSSSDPSNPPPLLPNYGGEQPTIKVVPADAPPPPCHSLPTGNGQVLSRPMSHIHSAYIFGRELDRGQFGVTHLVTHRVTRQNFVCKSIATRKLISPEDVADVRDEVQTMHHLTGHRNIVDLKKVLDRHNVHLVMELCTGSELFDRIIAKGHYSERAAAGL